MFGTANCKGWLRILEGFAKKYLGGFGLGLGFCSGFRVMGLGFKHVRSEFVGRQNIAIKKTFQSTCIFCTSGSRHSITFSCAQGLGERK